MALFLAAGAMAPAGAAPTPPAPASPPQAPAAAPPPPAQGKADSEQVLNVVLVPAPKASAAAGSSAAAGPATAAAPGTGPGQPGAAAGATGGAGRRPGGAVSSEAGNSYLWLLPAVLAAALLVVRFAWRWRPRRCSECGGALRQLDREAAFAELDMAERTEQLIGDVRHEVWRCADCSRIEKQSTPRDTSRLSAGSLGPPGSASFLRRYHQSGLSIWSPRTGAGKPPGPGRVTPPR